MKVLGKQSGQRYVRKPRFQAEVKMYCYKCPYTTKIQRKYGITTHCNLEPTHMDVTYCSETKERNTLCPFICKGTRFVGVNYDKYIDCNIANWIMEYVKEENK